MATKIKIEEMTSVTKEGQYGPYTVWTVVSGGTMYKTIRKKWNEHWKPGMEVIAEIERSQYGLRLQEPKVAAQAIIESPLLMKIHEELVAIRKLLTKPVVSYGAEPPPHVDEDMPNEEDVMPF